jgi:hypothetical protein
MKNIFEYQKPTDKSVAEIVSIREVLHRVHGLIQDIVPDSREKSIAITKLEEVSMWVNKAIVFNQKEE